MPPPQTAVTGLVVAVVEAAAAGKALMEEQALRSMAPAAPGLKVAGGLSAIFGTHMMALRAV